LHAGYMANSMHSLVARAGRLLPAAWIALLLLPSVVWVFRETSVWTWDQAFYGFWTLRLVDTLQTQGVTKWIELNLHALEMMPPLLVWLGQLFVPLRHLTGDVETAFMLLNLGAAAATLALIYRLTLSLGGSVLSGLAAATVCGCANLFIGLSRHYLTEPLQGMAAALSMVVALHADRRSWVRNAALVLILLAVAFAAKATSFIFVLPALTYVVVVLIVTWRDQRPAATKQDYLLLTLGAAGSILVLVWYGTNWNVMAMHFVQASIGEEVQAYRTASAYGEELKFWIGAVADALSLQRLIPLALALLTVLALFVSATRLRKDRNFLRDAITTNALFGFYLVGMIVVGILAYGLQINHDHRFLMPLIPPIAGMVGWMMTQLRHPGFATFVLLTAVASGTAANALTFGHHVGASAAWLWINNTSPVQKETFLPAIAATCKGDDAPSIVGVSISWTNSNTANFYAAKQRMETGVGCLYLSPPQDTVENAMAWLDLAKARYVITVAPELQDGPEFANPIAKPFAEQLATDSRFTLAPESSARFKIYRRIDTVAPAPMP
jgi:hypothetical protein